jgi:hypothetical protein
MTSSARDCVKRHTKANKKNNHSFHSSIKFGFRKCRKIKESPYVFLLKIANGGVKKPQKQGVF